MHDESTDTGATTTRSRRRSTGARRQQTVGVQVAMLGFATASLVGVLILGLVPAPGGVVGGTAMIVPAAIALGIVASHLKGASHAITRRYLATIATWTVLYIAVILVGTTVARTVTVFWIVGAVIVALPGALFIMAGRRDAT